MTGGPATPRSRDGSRESEAGLGPSAMAGEQRRAGRLRWAEARTSLAAFLLGGSVVAAVPLLLRAGFQGRAALALHVAGANATLLLAWGRAPGGMYQVRPGHAPRSPRGRGLRASFFPLSAACNEGGGMGRAPEHVQRVLSTPGFAVRPRGGSELKSVCVCVNFGLAWRES